MPAHPRLPSAPPSLEQVCALSHTWREKERERERARERERERERERGKCSIDMYNHDVGKRFMTKTPHQ